jgi:hypothetical protein
MTAASATAGPPDSERNDIGHDGNRRDRRSDGRRSERDPHRSPSLPRRGPRGELTADRAPNVLVLVARLGEPLQIALEQFEL